MIKRIKDTPLSSSDFHDEFYTFFNKQIDFVWGDRKEEPVYINVISAEEQLKKYLSYGGSKIIYLLGNPGVGKTAFLKHFFCVSDCMTHVNNELGIAVMSIGFRGQSIDMDVRDFISGSISSLCSDIEEQFGFRDDFYSEEGHLGFYEFIHRTMPSMLEHISSVDFIGKSKSEQRLYALKQARINDRLKYEESRLKYYLIRYCSNLERFILIMDNIEAFSIPIQQVITRDMLSVFSFILDMPSEDNNGYDKLVCDLSVYLIMSMREQTYRHLFQMDDIRAYEPVSYLSLEHPVDMGAYIDKMFVLADQSEDGEKWNIAHEIMQNLCHKFNNKYSDMFANLSNYEFTTLKRCYKKVFTNKVWILRGNRRKDFLEMSKTDYLFNNISVIRALACGNNAVYRGEKSRVIPNLFLSDEFGDNSIICLFVLVYFLRNDGRLSKNKIISAFSNLFRELRGILEIVERILNHFLKCGVIELDYKSVDGGETDMLILTPRGRELWNMFSSDSVLLELYREDHYCEDNGSFDFRSSYDLMERVGQYELFRQLFLYIEMLLLQERKLRLEAARLGSLNLLENCFGRKIITRYLLDGVLKSVEYSGYINNDDIKEAIKVLVGKMKAIDS